MIFLFEWRIFNYNFIGFYQIIKKLDSLSAAIGNNNVRSESHLIWFKADSSKGDYVNAIKHYQLYKSLSDSVFKGEKSKQINTLQIEFESDKKDKNIKIKETENKKFYLPIGKYKMTVSKDKVSESKSFEVSAPKK